MIERDHGGHRPREEFLPEVAERTGYDVPYAQFLAEYDQGLGGSYRLTDGVRAALDDARSAGWLFAVVTNGPTEVQTRKVRATGLDVLADAVCISQEVGVAKPDPLIFTTAAARRGHHARGRLDGRGQPRRRHRRRSGRRRAHRLGQAASTTG